MGDPLFWEKMLTTYGPLGLGWPMFIWAMIRIFALQDKITALSSATIEALTILKERIGGKSNG